MTRQVFQTMVDEVLHLLPSVEAMYYRLILLVGRPGTGKTAVLRTVADTLDTSVINAGLEVSARLYTEPAQLSLYVRDEATAIQWLRGQLKSKPQTFADINPQFMQQLSGWSKNEKQLDLCELLTQNFLSYDGKDPVPEQIHAYLSSNWKDLRGLPKDDPALIDKAKDRWYVPDPNKATDLEKLRERALLKEFDNYLAQIAEQPHKKLKVFRMEAIRTGFKQAWQSKDYQTIVTVAEKIPPSVLEEDDKLLMWYDQAVTRIGG